MEECEAKLRRIEEHLRAAMLRLSEAKNESNIAYLNRAIKSLEVEREQYDVAVRLSR